jgi:hypothetical protein
MKDVLTAIAQLTDFIYVCELLLQITGGGTCRLYLSHQICVTVHIEIHSMTHQNHVSGCHGDIFACEYGQHAESENYYMSVQWERTSIL